MTLFRQAVFFFLAVFWFPVSYSASMGLARDCAEHVEERLGAEEIEVVLASDLERGNALSPLEIGITGSWCWL